MLRIHKNKDKIIAELADEEVLISHTQDAIDLMAEAGSKNCTGIIIWEKNLHADFFRLSTGLAGDILQKFSNWDMKLAIVGDFTKYPGKSLQDFIRESNRGNRVFFVPTFNDAVVKLSGNS